MSEQEAKERLNDLKKVVGGSYAEAISYAVACIIELRKLKKEETI